MVNQGMFPAVSLPISRREFLGRGILLSTAAVWAPFRISAAEAPAKRMRVCLTPGSIGVSASQVESIALAERHRFDAVEPIGPFLATLSEQQIKDLIAGLKEKGLVWGAAGLP